MPFNRLNHSVLGEIRPRFALKVKIDPEIAIKHLESNIYKDRTVAGELSEHLLFLKTPSYNRHYWSPEMTVRIEIEEYTDYTTVACLVGPRQAVWALFAFIYSALALITVFGGMFGIIQYQQLGSSSWIWLLPIGILALSSVFTVAKFGQKKGRNQMLHLISFLYHGLEEITEVERMDNK